MTNGKSGPIRVLLADDHAILRGGLKEMLARQLEGAVFGEASNGDQALALAQNEQWDIVILDITMPGRSGLNVLDDLRQVKPDLPVLILSMHSEDQFARRVLKAGANGFVSKTAEPGEFIQAVHKVLSGGRYISLAFAERLASELNVSAGRPAREVLSGREFEILLMIGSGKSIGEIATQLNLSGTTVSTYRSRILEKLNLTTTADLIRYAVQNQLVS